MDFNLLKIGFIGAGRVGTAFGRYLHERGMVVSGYYDHHMDKITHAAENTQSRACDSAVEVSQISHIVLITTQDDKIANVCNGLCQEGAIDAHHFIGHMSGAHSSYILAPAQDAGAVIFSLHPLQAFASEDKAVADLPQTYLSLEGEDRRLESVEKLIGQIGNPYFRVAPEYKQLYHLAACIFSNYLVTLMDCGMEAMSQAGIPAQQGFEAMLPLIRGTLANISRMGTDKALTGPIARGDLTTIQQHLKTLTDNQLSSLGQFYQFLGQKTLTLAAKAVLKDKNKAAALKKLFETNLYKP